MLTTFQECKEQFRLYTEGWHERYCSPAMAFGSACHYVLERSAFAASTRRNIRTWVDRWEKQNRHTFPRLTTEKSEIYRLLEVAVETMTVYFDYWQDELAERNNLAAEQPFNLPYRFTRLCGTLDLVYQKTTGLEEIYLEDTKTGGMVPEVQQDAFPVYTQFLLYMVAARTIYGETPAGITLNQIRRCGLKQLKGNSLSVHVKRVRADIEKRPAYYFAKVTQEYTPEQVMAWEQDQLIPMLIDVSDWAKGLTPRYMSPAALTRWNRKNEYFDALVNGDFSCLVCDNNAHWMKYAKLGNER